MRGRGDPADPRGVIAEAYRMDGIGEAECRSIFLDWALGLPADTDTRAAIDTLLARHGDTGHPMTGVLREGLGRTLPKRRGGAQGRRGR
ncbi:hypothetical protein ROJ8625_01816 [Roseivivax jejudonensis]|uniref:Uncharacterized protein n=1 Tax=Roseivivax jejudonensis TaxID=1529041 RepID=A0A1X6Z2Y3_9RHOB|nr:hypothetical protein [Roseivivax jejudonensis]SLN38983.1 hypothetical protein ROJ8625_01816 [Roseivivax jejudonensis]